MKNIKNIIMSAVASATVGLGVSSCSLDLLPLNEIVLENFWTDKNDVESVVTSCYASMQEGGYVADLLVWGEDRSDNVVQGDAGNYPVDLRDLLKGNLKTTNSYLSWAPFYNVINQCNTVLEYAPRLEDPNYTESDLRINIAECKFIRAFSYFTLVKSFKDVPFTFQASIDDTKSFRIPQSKHEDILDSLIVDLESCKDYAPRRYSVLSHNTGKVTRAAMYSLLADIYLWRASDVNLPKDTQNEYYRKCIECCDYVINHKIDQYENNQWEGIDLRQYVDKEVYGEYGYPLLAEELSVGTNKNGPAATNWIFGGRPDGSNTQVPCFETIFEITYRDYSSGAAKANDDVDKHFGTSSTSQLVIANEKVLESKPESGSYSDKFLFSVPSDYRSIASFYYNETNGGYNIYKYVIGSNRAGAQSYAEYGSVGAKYTPATMTQSYNGTSPNWIIYRLSEIMLFRAEAEIELANNLTPIVEETEEPAASKKHKASIAVSGSSLSDPQDLYDDAFRLISAVYRRSNPIVKTQSKFAPSKPTTYEAFQTLLMNERRREFLFEGKRYFDLVRFSRRVGNTRAFRDALSQKYGSAGAAVAIKMVNMDFMYLPVLRAEMKVNPSLQQNSQYLDEQENIKN